MNNNLCAFTFFLFTVLLISWSNGDSYYSSTYKICTANFDSDACQQIARDQEYACTENTKSTVDCFLGIDEGLSHFAVVTAEEALLAAPLVSEKVVVVGEIHSEHAPYQTAVIVRKPFDGNYENLRGKRFCHPGFNHDELVTKLVLEEFESTIIGLNSGYCDTEDNLTIVEKRIKAVAEFFDTSCRPGKWTESDEFDAELKTKYPSLCELCGTDKCNVNYQVPFNETLSCLTDKLGDVALTTLNDALLFFNSSTNSENFQYLCPNGSVSESTNPCTWTNQLHRLIVTGSDNAEAVKSYILNKLPTYVLIGAFNVQSSVSDATYLAALEKILRLSRSDRINITDTVPLNSYVTARRSIPTLSNSIQCNTSVKWCTLNGDEQQKCKWLQQAALNAGLQPVTECVQSNDTDVLSCLNDIKSEKADISFTDVNYGYIALKKGLSVVAYTETDTRQLSSIMIAVYANNATVTSLNDLKGRQACFPEYGGKEWLAFIDTLRTDKIMENSCDYGKLFSDFVGNSCVPGANSDDYEIANADTSKLCSQCIPHINLLTHSYCNADSGNKYYGTDGALRCLQAGAGEYAVITRNDIVDFANTATQFLVLCRNGSLASYTGFNVDEGAPLTIITAGEVVAKATTSKKDDIVLLLREIELEFGQRLDKPFKAFESFNHTRDLLFPDSTPGLTFGGSAIKYVDNFKTLLRNSERCILEINNAAAIVTVSSTALITFVVYFALRLF